MSRRRNDSSADVTVLKLEEALSKLRRLYDQEVARNREARDDLEECRTKLYQQARVNALDRKSHEDKKIEILERNLAIANGKIGKREAQLKSLRSSVEALRAHKDTMARKYVEQARELRQAKEELDRSMLRMKSITTAMGAIEADMAVMGDQYTYEKAMWAEEIMGLRNYIESDQKMREVIYKRSMQREVEAAKGTVHPGGIRENLELHRWKAGVKNIKEVVTVERAMERIQEVMGGDLDDAVRMFVDGEKCDHQLLENCNQLSREIAKLKSDNETLKKQLSERDSSVFQRTDTKKVAKLEASLMQAKNSREKLATQLADCRRRFNETKQLILSLSQKTGSIGPVDDYLLRDGVTDQNVAVFLGLVEERVLDLIHHPVAARDMRSQLPMNVQRSPSTVDVQLEQASSDDRSSPRGSASSEDISSRRSPGSPTSSGSEDVYTREELQRMSLLVLKKQSRKGGATQARTRMGMRRSASRNNLKS